MNDIQKLIAQYLDGELTPAERSELQQRLLADEAARDEFAQILLLANDLQASRSTDDLELSSLLASRRTSPEVASPRSHNRRFNATPWLLAASVAILVTAAALRFGQEPIVVPQVAMVLPDGSQSVAAYVGRTTNCVWTANPVAAGSQLNEGDVIALSKGVAEIIFDSGARVIAQGPCELEVDDAQSFSLALGDVSVLAEYGFKVTTPAGIVLDLGTEFGVSVDDRGTSEVHVFAGEVAFQAIDVGGSFHGKPLKLEADRACRFALDGITLEEFEANEAKFDWRNRPLLKDSEVPPLQVRNGLALWLAADREVVTGADGRVDQWRDLLVGDNTSPEDALQTSKQHRPKLVEDGIHGRPAIAFGENGTFLVTPPLHTTDEQTAFVVCELNDTNPTFQQVLNYNGPPQRVIPPKGGIVRPAVFEICLRDRPEYDGKFAICGEVFSGFRGEEHEVVKDVVEAFNVMGVNEPRIVAFRYSLASGTMSLFLDGQPSAERPASTPIAISSRKVLGRHPILGEDRGIFRGELGEVLLYNRALSDEEVREVSAYLGNRFDIPVK